MAYDYDLFVIGAGSGGVRASRIAAGHGARVGICEDYRVGGTCVIRGCVPKKLLVYGSKFAHEFEDAAAYGWTVAGPTHSWATLRDNVNKEVDRLNGVYLRLLDGAGVKLHMGRGRLMDRHTIEIGGETITAEKILVATGGAPVVPEIPRRASSPSPRTRRSICPSCPSASPSSAAATSPSSSPASSTGWAAQVDLVLRRDRVLRGFDEECRTAVHDALKESGIKMRTEMQIERIEATNGKAPFTVHTQLGGMFETDLVMYATGRAPNTSGHRAREGRACSSTRPAPSPSTNGPRPRPPTSGRWATSPTASTSRRSPSWRATASPTPSSATSRASPIIATCRRRCSASPSSPMSD